MSIAVPSEIHVDIRLFGPIEVRVGGRDLPRLNSRRALWLIACLALRDGRPIERSRLAGLLWPDSLESSALHNLRQALSDLRRALGPAAGILESDTPRTVRLNLEAAWIDVLAFDAAVSDGRPLALERAAEMYGGSLVEGCDEPWATEARAQREQTYLGLLQDLATFHAGRKDHATAAEYLRRAIRTDPYSDLSVRLLMEALAANGEFGAAEQAYRELRVRLRRNLNAEPDPSTIALASQIRSRAAKPEHSPPAPARRLGRLPRPLTEMIGRDAEVLNICACLQRCRIVTLTGLGGIGKTRLALAAAESAQDQYPDGVWFVDLAPIVNASLLPKTVAAALGVRERSDQEVIDTVAEVITGKRLLIVVDNCEHMIAECAGFLETLLSKSPGLTVLATSRQHLGVIGELAWQVPPLSLPAVQSAGSRSGRHESKSSLTSDLLLQSEAVRLFVERAGQTKPAWKPSLAAYKTIGEICCRLEGMPLAIELAAARARALPPREILARLRDRFALLTHGSRAIARHETLRAAIDWSYDLLAPAERVLLGRLSVFAGGWTVEAAQFVCAGTEGPQTHVAELLAGLAGKSLILYEEADENPRYRMLETVREYARDRMTELDDGAQVRLRHTIFFLDLAEEAALNLQGPEQASWMDRLEVEHDNLRAALRFSLTGQRPDEESPAGVDGRPSFVEDPPEAGLRLAGALLRFWMVRGYFTEGRDWLAAVLGEANAHGRTTARARALNAAGCLARDQGDYAAAWSYLEESLTITRERGDAPRMSASFSNLAIVALDRGDYATARSYYEQALEMDRGIGDRHSEGGSLCGLGNVAYMEGDYPAACSFWERALVISRELGNRGWEALSLGNMGDAEMRQGELSIARSHLEQALAINREVGDRGGEARDLNNLGRVALELGDCEEARSLYRQAIVIRIDHEIHSEMAWSLEAFASLEVVEGHAERAACLWGAAAALRQSLSSPMASGDRDAFERSIATVRHTLGSEAFSAAFESGGTMDLNQATAYALSSG